MVTLDNGMTIEEAREAAKRKKNPPSSNNKTYLIDGKYDPQDFIKPKKKKKVVNNNNESSNGGEEETVVNTDTTETTIDLDSDFDFSSFDDYFNSIFSQ